MHEKSEVAEEPKICKSFAFPGDSRSIVAARQAMMEFLKPYCSSELDEMDIFIALQEALANAVYHGCKNDPSKVIHGSVAIDPAGFTISIRDPGPGFDVEAAMQFNEGGRNLTEHGRGICLMRSLIDRVTFQHGGAEVCLRKLRTATSGGV